MKRVQLSWSLETAERIKKLSSEIGIKHIAAVINKGGAGKVNARLEELGIPILGEIPFDQQLMQADLEKRAPIEAGGEAVNAIVKIKEKLMFSLVFPYFFSSIF